VTPYGPISRGMNLDLTDDEKTALIRELDGIIRDDRYPLSPRILMLKAILGKLRPEPERPPLPCDVIYSNMSVIFDNRGIVKAYKTDTSKN
jgi:hypothetical protein